jgi:hypothetical protein
VVENNLTLRVYPGQSKFGHNAAGVVFFNFQKYTTFFNNQHTAMLHVDKTFSSHETDLNLACHF